MLHCFVLFLTVKKHISIHENGYVLFPIFFLKPDLMNQMHGCLFRSVGAVDYVMRMFLILNFLDD